jgi:phosphatidylinositol alpha-mannosyltransferase
MVASGDPQALAKAMVRLLRDPTRRSELAVCGRSVVVRYDWTVVARRIVDVYETVAG